MGRTLSFHLNLFYHNAVAKSDYSIFSCWTDLADALQCNQDSVFDKSAPKFLPSDLLWENNTKMLGFLLFFFGLWERECSVGFENTGVELAEQKKQGGIAGAGWVSGQGGRRGR